MTIQWTWFLDYNRLIDVYLFSNIMFIEIFMCYYDDDTKWIASLYDHNII